MNLIQQQEEADYSASARFDRFDGFDRGDTDYDYEAEQQARNEADEQAFTAWAAEVGMVMDTDADREDFAARGALFDEEIPY
jgi:hypothetical protein